MVTILDDVSAQGSSYQSWVLVFIDVTLPAEGAEQVNQNAVFAVYWVGYVTIVGIQRGDVHGHIMEVGIPMPFTMAMCVYFISIIVGMN